jgi:hypothetical protein
VRHGILIILLLTSCSPKETRKKIILIDSGINVSSRINPFLCKYGHKSFIEGSSWNEDRHGHGSLMAEVIIQKLDLKEHCIVIVKAAEKGIGSSIKANAYASALRYLASLDFNIILLALEDVSYFYKEPVFVPSSLTNLAFTL